jgi:hypothetical protein
MAFFSCHGSSRMSLLSAERFQQKCWTSFSERFLRSCPALWPLGAPAVQARDGWNRSSAPIPRSELRDNIVWYCHKPCRYIFKSIPERVGATPRGFRCGRLTLDVDGQAAGDRAWRMELTRLWLTIADLILPFYAEIRMGECPTKSWWWNGIPTASPAAC